MAGKPVGGADQKTPARAWAILAVVYIASFMAPMAQFKVPALADWIIPQFLIPQVGPENVNFYFGMMMSVLSIIGVILAFPTAAIIRKLGMRMSMVVSVGALAIGTLVCAVTDSYVVLLVGRMIEGVGIGLVGVVAPACVSIWFPDKTRGTALGIWASWFPLGITLMFNIAPMIAAGFDWKAVYWFCIICDVIALILFLAVFRMPKMEGRPPEEASIKEGFKYLKNSKLWILAIVFFLFNFFQLGFLNTFYNQFLMGSGLSPQLANSLTSITTAIGIFMSPASGIIYDRVPYKYKNIPMIVCFLMFFVSLFFAFATGDGMMTSIWVFIIVVGIGAGLGAGSLRPYAPSLVPNTALGASMVMALLQFMQNLGAAIGSPVYGGILDSMGWDGANHMLLMPICIIAIILCLFVRSKKNAPQAGQPEEAPEVPAAADEEQSA